MLRVDARTGDIYDGQRRVGGLSPKLAAVARVLLSAPGETVPRDVLHAALGYRPGTYRRGVDVVVSRLRRRLPGIIWQRRGFGYRWVPPD